MIRVADEEYYRLEVDPKKNRIYFLIRGDWTDPKKLSNWIPDIEKTIGYCTRGFTELIDWTSMRAITLTDQISAHHVVAMKAGIKKAARVFEREHFVAVQLNRVATQTGFPIKVFFDRAEAESWLDAG